MIRRFPHLLVPLAALGLLAACLEQPTEDKDAAAPDVMVTEDAMLPDAAMPDAAVNCTVDDLVDQYQCGSGRKCTLTDDQNHVGCAEAGVAAAYGSCEPDRPDNCSIATLCMDAKNPGEYLCLPFCAQEGTYCPGGVCTYSLSVAGGTAYLCEPEDNCNPLSVPSTDCEAGEACYISRVGDDLTYCKTEGTAQLGESCDGDYSCAAGMTCFGPQGQSGTCRTLCLSGTNDCGGQPCTPVTGTYGICI